MISYPLAVGTKVRKTGGHYEWPGVVVAEFKTLNGVSRYVVECTVPEVSGALHIFNANQLTVEEQKQDG